MGCGILCRVRTLKYGCQVKSSKVMSKTPLQLGWDYGYVCTQSTPDSLDGRLFELVEALGLPSKQEDSLKSLIRKTVCEVFQDAVYITPERHSEIREDYFKRRKEAESKGEPVSAI